MNNFIRCVAVATLSLSIQSAYALKATCHSSHDSKLGVVEVETFSTNFGERARIKIDGVESILPCSTDVVGNFICAVYFPAIRGVEKFTVSTTGEISYAKSAAAVLLDGKEVNYNYVYTCERSN